MEITFLKHRPGKTITVNDRLGTAFIRAGYAIEKETPSPVRARAPRVVTAPADQPPELATKLKSELVEMATGMGASLDGSETKADLITLIEQARRRYSRRDMQASE